MVDRHSPAAHLRTIRQHPGLAELVEHWDGLPDCVRQTLVRVARFSNLTKQPNDEKLPLTRPTCREAVRVSR